MIKGSTMMDLHLNMMEQIQRLAEAETPEELEREQQRAKAMANVGRIVIDNAKLLLDAEKFSDDTGVEHKNTIYALEE